MNKVVAKVRHLPQKYVNHVERGKDTEKQSGYVYLFPLCLCLYLFLLILFFNQKSYLPQIHGKNLNELLIVTG